MKSIKNIKIRNKVSELILKASFELPSDILLGLKKALKRETSSNARTVLQMMVENSSVAKKDMLPLCQDCGNVYIDIFIGKDYMIEDLYGLEEELQGAIAEAYKGYNLRTSVVDDPFFERENTFDNTPGYICFYPSDIKGIKIKVYLKGGGSENCSYLLTENPGISEETLIGKVYEKVTKNVTRCCPPVILGIGIGSSSSHVLKLSREASFREIGKPNPDKRYAGLEKKILDKVNSSGIGAQGLGGNNTALACNIEYAPCHMATLPIGISMGCHSTRRSEALIT